MTVCSAAPKVSVVVAGAEIDGGAGDGAVEDDGIVAGGAGDGLDVGDGDGGTGGVEDQSVGAGAEIDGGRR